MAAHEPRLGSTSAIVPAPVEIAQIAATEARARDEMRMRKLASIGGGSPMSDAEAFQRFDHATRQPGDDYAGRTPEERECIAHAVRRSPGRGRQVRRQLYLRDGLARIDAMHQWAIERRRRSLDDICSRKRAFACGASPSGRASQRARRREGRSRRHARRTSRAASAGPSGLDEGDDGPHDRRPVARSFAPARAT